MLQLPPPEKPGLPPEPVFPDVGLARESARPVPVQENGTSLRDGSDTYPAIPVDFPSRLSAEFPAGFATRQASVESVEGPSGLKRTLHKIISGYHADAVRHLELHCHLAMAQVDELLQTTGDVVVSGPGETLAPLLPTAPFHRVSSTGTSACSMKSVPAVNVVSPNGDATTSVTFNGGAGDTVEQEENVYTSASFNHMHDDGHHDRGEKFFNRLAAHGVDPSTRLDSIAGVVVMLNTIYIVVELQFVGYESAIFLDLQAEDGGWTGAERIFMFVDHAFNSLYVAEMLLRLWRLRSLGLLWRHHWFDLAIVFTSSIDLYILQPLDSGMGTLNILRVVRFFKVLRALRVARSMTLFAELRILVTTIGSCFRALFWSMVLLGMIMAMGGMFLCRLLQSFIMDESNDYGQRVWVWKYYGSSLRAMYTMFEMTLAGCWPTYVRPILDHVSPWYAVFFMSYILGVVFAVIRIITAIFLKRTLQVASQDEELMVSEKLKERESYLRKLRIFFEEADASGDGAISLDEFEKILANPKVRPWFQLLELEFHEADHLFKLLDDGDGLITIDDFIEGLLRLKGHAWSIDVVSLQREVGKVNTQLSDLQDDFYSKFGSARHSRHSRSSSVAGRRANRIKHAELSARMVARP